MTLFSRRAFLVGTLGLVAASVAAFTALFISCNDTGTSPYTPAITYKSLGVVVVKNSAMVPDSVVASGSAAINGYAVNPTLPTGLTLNATTGVISGTALADAPAMNYTVTATGPSGTNKAVVTLCVSDTAAYCQVGKGPFAPIVAYPGIAAQKGVSITDSAVNTGGAITGYAVSSPLPAGLTLNATTGVISGKVSALFYPGITDTITATGLNGTSIAKVSICVGDSSHFCDVRAAQISYAPAAAGGGPGFVWSNVNVAITPDTPMSVGGKVTGYSAVSPLPDGILLNASTGIISGTPTLTSAAKDYKIVANGFFGNDTETVYVGVYPSSYPTVLLTNGEARFDAICTGCHGVDAKGGQCPPLYHSDFLTADPHRAIRIQLQGASEFRGQRARHRGQW